MVAEYQSSGPVSRWAGRSIPQVFEEVVARFPDHPAVLSEKSDATYRQLDGRANRIAGHLLSLPAGSPRRVALLFDAGVEAISAILGVLKAGDAYVPLDPADPFSRIEFILDDCQADLILTSAARNEFAAGLARGHREILRVEDLEAGNPGSPARRRSVSPDAPAYLFYTSGSTGKPKGVIQTHRNLLHFVEAYCGRLEINEQDRLSLLYTLSFSASNMDIYGALMSGAALCPYDIRKNGAPGLARWIKGTRITVLHMVPTLFRHLLAELPEKFRFKRVRCIDLGGEPVFASDVTLWRDRFRPHSLLVNHLAATEASVIAQYVVPPGGGDIDGPLPAGQAAPGIVVQIIREDGTECRLGEPGEIVVCSPYVSPGYWNRPELTATAFDRDPLREGWRRYHTGDLGRMGADGLIFALGRKDDRVKIRGHSVDLREVESALRDIPGVRDAAVVALGQAGIESGPLTLAAYVAGSVADIAIRSFLENRLPSYMIPSEINLIEELPRTATGKIDRKALWDGNRPDDERRRDLIPPVGELETGLAEIYARLLDLDQVGRTEDFFELGGNSLTAARLQVETKRAFGVELLPADLLRDATVAGLAGWIRDARIISGSVSSSSFLLIPIRESGTHPPLFFVHGAVGQPFVSPAFLQILGPDQPFYAFRARGGDGKGEPRRSIHVMVEDYIAAMRAVRPAGPYAIGGLCAGGIVALEMARRLQVQGEALAPLLLIDPPPLPRVRGFWDRAYRLLRLYAAQSPVSLLWSGSPAAKLRRELRLRATQGRAPIAPHDGISVEAETRAALAFKIALQWHKPLPYNGAVRVFSSRKRQKHFDRRNTWGRYLVGDLRVIAVSREHEEVLDPANVLFATEFRRCLDEVRTSITGIETACLLHAAALTQKIIEE